MYLKSLELHGFKSFPNRTVLNFERGTTVIVGPNGSGKSNISDAMRWVLGELSSRNIRGTKMEDVIFGGTDDRRQMSFAEVSVTFDNTDPEHRLDCDYDEVTVTRRYFRTGESEYLINRQPKRLRDIYELFMNTGVGREGYSIIGQGKVAEMISKKSEERRNIFEEAAGISKYRHRKEESEKKLAATEDNLNRVKDILAELESRVVPLEKEAERARKFLDIREEKKRADVSLWLYDTKKIIDDIKKAEDSYRLSSMELEAAEEAIRDLNRQSENLYNKTLENRQLSAQLYENIKNSTERLHALDNAYNISKNEFSHSLETIEECRKRIGEIEISKSNLSGNSGSYDDRIAELEKHVSSITDERDEVIGEQKKLSDDINEIETDLREQLDELSAEENRAKNIEIRLNVLKNSSESDSSKSEDTKQEIEKYTALLKDLEAEAERCNSSAQGFKDKIAEKEEELKRCSDELAGENEKREKIHSLLSSLKPDYGALIQRADTLKRMNEHFEGYGESVKFVMRLYGEGRINNCGKIYGPLSTLINVDKKYITAIETALGASLQNIVVDDERSAKAAIYALKEARAGRATFYPVSAIRPATETDEIRAMARREGYVDRADRLVSSDKEFRNIIEMLLLRTVIFDNMENAAAAAKASGYRVKIVTLDGQVINAGGAFTGGSAKRDSGILSRGSEISDILAKAEELKRRIDENEKNEKRISDRIAELQSSVRECEQQRDLLFTLSRSHLSALDNANAKLEANKSVLERLREDFESLSGSRQRAEDEIASLNAVFLDKTEKIEAIKNYRAKRSVDLGRAEDERDALIEKGNELYIRISELRKDIEAARQMKDSISGRILELDEEKASQEARIAELSDKRSRLEDMQRENREEASALEEELRALNRRRTDAESGADEYDRALAEIRNRLKDKNSSKDVCYQSNIRNENRLAQLRENQDKLGSKLWEDYEITYEDAVALGYPPVTEENRAEIAEIQVSCRNKMRALGNVNVNAIDEYAEVKVRYDSLSSQVNDLNDSHAELLQIINRLEEEMRTSFLDAFNKINENFGIVFKELFGGGTGELSLTDPDDVLTSGIEIKAAPPGKIIKSLSLLSGGEQSFVAIALFFSILKVNPTPFCILDEIEAALDEVNVYRFGEYIKRFCHETQFVLITHRRGTMEVGDRLYGVTMPQRGISQVIAVDVGEIESKQKELLDGVL